MSGFLSEVAYVIDDQLQVTVKFTDGSTLNGRLEYNSANSCKLLVDTGEPYVINSAHVLWVRTADV